MSCFLTLLAHKINSLTSFLNFSDRFAMDKFAALNTCLACCKVCNFNAREN